MTTEELLAIQLGWWKNHATVVSYGSIVINEITLTNGLIFNDTEKSLSYLQLKRNTSNASETVYDKYNTSQTMTNAQIATAIGTVATSISTKDDDVKATISAIQVATSINEVKSIAGIYQERTINFTVDIDGVTIDDVNQTTNEATSTCVMEADGSINLNDVAWLPDSIIGVKSVAGIDVVGSYTYAVTDSNLVHTADCVLDSLSPIITCTPLADGLPVTFSVILKY